MYTISCCRVGKLWRSNTKKKGIFKKKFKTLSELTYFWEKCNRSIFFPNISNELTKDELNILQRKFYAVVCKKNNLK